MKMNSLPTSAVMDDREEGEIVDDDFEDISDSSITIPIYSGKSVSTKEHLPAISLSSVTEVEEQKPRPVDKVRRRHKCTRKKNSKSYIKRKSHRRSTCSDSDSDDYLELDRRLQRQLKAAIRVDNEGEQQKNSLRSRLRAMTKLEHDSDHSEQKNEDNNDQIEQKVNSDEADTELTQLRLEALRTAVLNKFMHRKKRKVKEIQDNDILSDISIKTDTSETNKENTHIANENVKPQIPDNCSKKLCLGLDKPAEAIDNKIEISNNIVIENNTAPEDDEDVLRALLLASMSKKITNETNIKSTVLPSKSNVIKQTVPAKTSGNDAKHLGTKNVTNLKNCGKKNNIIITTTQLVQIPKVKPLIIAVNADSDTDEETFNKTIKYTSNKAGELKKVNMDIENTVDRFLKEQRAKVEAALSPIPKRPVKANNSVILEKSSVKLLPKVKQIEYQKLLQKLKNAEKKPRVRRSSQKFCNEGKPVGYTPKKFVRSKVPVKQINTTSTKIDQIPGFRTEARTLHKALKEMQIQKNGRLQIQEKYRMLTPIVKKINEISIERKQYDEEVKRLLEELAEAKKKLLKSHQDFTAHVKELVDGKEVIDKSLRNGEIVKDPKTCFTSTPIKEIPPFESFEASSIPTTTPNNSIPSENTNVKIDEPSKELQKAEEIDVPINPGDPNDIDKIYAKQKNTFHKYISPLGNVKREVMDDPFCIICPYDVNGNCRDQECIYRHIFK